MRPPDHDHPDRTRAAARSPTETRGAPEAAARLLLLQHQVGNQTVSALVQRQADQEYVPDLGAPERKPQPETSPEVLGRTDLDEVFRSNTVLRERVVTVSAELGIDPGMLAASLLAEKGAATWSRTSGTVASETLGLDDWFEPNVQRRLRTILAAHPGLGLRLNEVENTGETWDTSTEKAGGAEKPRGRLDATKAVAAFGAYYAMQEGMLRDVIANKEKELSGGPIRTLDDLTPEQRLTVLRVGLNAGVGTATSLFLKIARGGDIPRTGRTTRNPRNAARTATLHVARAIHLAQAIFGRPSSDYRPSQAPITAKEAAIIFDRPELKQIPDRVVPFDY